MSISIWLVLAVQFKQWNDEKKVESLFIYRSGLKRDQMMLYI